MSDIVDHVSTLATAIVLVGGSLIAWLQYRASNRHARQERTLHLDESTDLLNGTRVQLESILPRSLAVIDYADVVAAAERSSVPDLEVLLRTVLARLQIFSLAVQSGMADEEFAFELLGSTVVWYGTAYRPYVQAIRDMNQQPLLYGDLLCLADRWTLRLQHEAEEYLESGMPYFGRSWLRRRRMMRRVRMAQNR